jgi:Ni/Co efflux regulator RcnB
MKRVLLLLTILGLAASPLMIPQAEAASVTHVAKHQARHHKKHMQKRAAKHRVRRHHRKTVA